MRLEIKSVLFLGVGGISVSQLASAFKSLGIDVYGYDVKKSEVTKRLESEGVKFSTKFLKSFCNVDLCVKSSAIGACNPYLCELDKRGIKVVERAVALSWLCSKFKTVIAVAGTHGKTTTATLIYEMLKADGRKVSCHIGAEIDDVHFDFKDDFLVVEACEYNKSFLELFPNITVVTNVEPEHIECYGSFYNLKNAFWTFLKRGEKRFVFDSPSVKFLKKYKNLQFVEQMPDCERMLEGEYNLNNISLARAVCLSLGVDENTIAEVVKNFAGVKRRNEFVGKFKDTKIYIDYAHHPTEVKNFVEMFRARHKNSLIVFQPHTYSRTKYFFNQFVELFSGLDNICLFKEYPARETHILGKSAFELYESVKAKNPYVMYAEKYKDIKKIVSKYSVVAFVGAGDINLVAEKLVRSRKY